MAPEKALTLSAAPAFRLPDLADAASGLAARESAEQRFESVFHDTADLRLVRSGCTVEHRSGTGWVLTMPGRSRTYEGRAKAVPAEASRLVAAYRLERELQPVARLATRRRVVRVGDDQGDLLEIVDDEVSALDGRRVAARFRTVGVRQLDERGAAATEAAIERLAGAGAGSAETEPALVRALGSLARRPPHLRPPELHAGAGIAEAVRAALAGPAGSLLEHDAGLRLDDDPDAIRKVRVAARRLRSLLRTLQPLLEPEWAAQVAGELRWLAGELSEVRSLQVRVARLGTLAGSLEPDDRRALAALTAAAAPAAATRRPALAGLLDSDRYLELLLSVAAAAGEPRLRPGEERPALEVLPELAAASWRRLRRAARAVDGDDALHPVRIRTKQARYAAEAVALVEPSALDLVAALEQVQAALGRHNDAQEMQGWLQEQAGSGRRAFLAGRLYEIERLAARAAAAEFRAAWRAARRPRLRKWMG